MFPPILFEAPHQCAASNFSLVAAAGVTVTFWYKPFSMLVHIAILVHAAGVLFVTINARCPFMT